MNVFDGALPGVRVIEPDVYTDDRGDFRETWNARDYGRQGLNLTFVQDNLSRSRPGVLRGFIFRTCGRRGSSSRPSAARSTTWWWTSGPSRTRLGNGRA